MERIAVGLSDPASQKAVEWAIDRAMTRQAELTLVAAYDPLVTPRRQIVELLRATRERIGVRSPRTVARLTAIEDDPVRAMADASEHSDLLVVGTHLRHRLASRAEATPLKIARHARCATVIVPEAWIPTSRGTVIVGADDDSSDAAIEFAAREAEHRGAHLEIVRAWTAPMPAYDPMIWIADTESELRISNRERLDESVAKVTREHPLARVGGLLAESLPGAALRERSAHADLVVIGSHRRGPLTALIAGSTAHELLGHIDPPLCIVPMES